MKRARSEQRYSRSFVESLKRAVNEANDAHQIARQNLGEVERRLRTRDGELAAAQSQIRVVQGDLDRARVRAGDAEKELGELRAKHDGLTKSFDQLGVAHNTLAGERDIAMEIARDAADVLGTVASALRAAGDEPLKAETTLRVAERRLRADINDLDRIEAGQAAA